MMIFITSLNLRILDRKIHGRFRNRYGVNSVYRETPNLIANNLKVPVDLKR